MKKVVSAVIGLGLMCMATVSFSAEKPAAAVKYLGSKSCIGCHKSLDDSTTVWAASKHAKAYETLAGDAAKKINPTAQKDPKCVKCHVTGLDKEGGFSMKADAKANASVGEVTCESCHGPGKNYMGPMMKSFSSKVPIAAASMKDQGLIIPNEDTCKGCHNAESPIKKEYKFDEMLKAIKHGVRTKK